MRALAVVLAFLPALIFRISTSMEGKKKTGLPISPKKPHIYPNKTKVIFKNEHPYRNSLTHISKKDV